MAPFLALFNYAVLWGILAIWWGSALGALIDHISSKSMQGFPFNSGQQSKNAGCTLPVTIIVVIVVTVLTQTVFFVPGADYNLGVFERIAAVILGLLASSGLVYSLVYGSDIQDKGYKRLYTGALIIAGLALAARVVLLFIKIELPFSVNYFWIPIGLPVLLMLINVIRTKTRALSDLYTQAHSTTLDHWVITLERRISGENISLARGKIDHRQKMITARSSLFMAMEHNFIGDPEFFNLTEQLLLNLVLGREVIIQNQDIYDAREEVVRTLQALYLYALDHFPQYEMHPAIKKALK